MFSITFIQRHLFDAPFCQFTGLTLASGLRSLMSSLRCNYFTSRDTKNTVCPQEVKMNPVPIAERFSVATLAQAAGTQDTARVSTGSWSSHLSHTKRKAEWSQFFSLDYTKVFQFAVLSGKHRTPFEWGRFVIKYDSTVAMFLEITWDGTCVWMEQGREKNPSFPQQKHESKHFTDGRD